ncbi:hypothetical protein D3C80_643900 [compost metagenome]
MAPSGWGRTMCPSRSWRSALVGHGLHEEAKPPGRFAFNGLLADVQPASHVLLRQAPEFAQLEHLAASAGQGLHGLAHLGQEAAVVGDHLGRVQGLGRDQLVHQVGDVDPHHRRLAQMVLDRGAHRLEQEGAGRADAADVLDLEQAAIDLLDQVVLLLGADGGGANPVARLRFVRQDLQSQPVYDIHAVLRGPVPRCAGCLRGPSGPWPRGGARRARA